MLACLGLFIGARRWIGRFGGLAAVGLYCSSGVALAFAWRDYMPTFTGASLIAAGSGSLLWAVLATEANSRRRTWAGLVGFVALEIATFVRYTNILILGCAVLAVIVAWWLQATRLSLRTLCWWLASVVVFAAGVAIFNDLVYGGLLKTSYRPSEITFGVGAISLLGAWLGTRIPGRAWLASLTLVIVIMAMFGLGMFSFYAIYAAFGVPLSG